MTRVKICGITREEDAQLAVQLGARAIGLVLWPGSPRCLGAQRARAIVETLPAHVTAVGVFVNQPLDEVRRAAEVAALGAVQLHGEESLEYAHALLHPVVKAVPVTSEPPPASGSVSIALAETTHGNARTCGRNSS